MSDSPLGHCPCRAPYVTVDDGYRTCSNGHTERTRSHPASLPTHVKLHECVAARGGPRAQAELDALTAETAERDHYRAALECILETDVVGDGGEAIYAIANDALAFPRKDQS